MEMLLSFLAREDPQIKALKRSVQKQTDCLVKLGLHERLNPPLNESRYRHSLSLRLPKTFIPPKPGGIFALPLVVDPRVDWELQGRLADLASFVDDVEDLETIPASPYLAWIPRGGTRFGVTTFAEVREQLFKREAASPMIEAVSLFLHYRDIFLTDPISPTGSWIVEEEYDGQKPFNLTYIPYIWRAPLVGWAVDKHREDEMSVRRSVNIPVGRLTRSKDIIMLGN